MYPFRVVTHPTADIQHPTILLHTSQGKRYLFGKAPEGLQRSLNEQKIRVSKLSGIFLTGKLDWESMGGLPGMILTVSDQGKKDLNIYHGSNIIEYIIATWRYFVFRFGMDLRPKVIPNGDVHNDEIMDVKSIVLKKSAEEPDQPLNQTLSESLRHIVSSMFPLDVKNNIPLETNDKGEYTAYDTEELPDVERSRRGSSPPADPSLLDPHVHVKLPNLDNNSTSTCYAIQLHSVRGKFNPKAAIDLGVPKGPSFAKLAAGEEVTLVDGTIVQPSQVLSEKRVFETVLMVDIPSPEFVPAALSADWGSNVGVIYHFLGADIEPFEGDYLKFIESFGPGCKHYISHPDYCPNSLIFKGSANVTMKLKNLQPSTFNLPETQPALKTKPSHIPDNVMVLLQGQVFNVEANISSERNKYIFDNSLVNIKTDKDWDANYDKEVVPLNLRTNTTKQETISTASVSSSEADLISTKPLKDQVETITFGTGSALPSKYRNVISNLVRTPYRKDGELHFRSVLLDAGENTIGSMKRTLQLDQIGSYFRELQLIFLSHLHADHHLGIISIIKEWLKYNKDNTNTLYVVSPWQYTHFVKEWMKVESDLSGLERITHISCEDFLVGRPRNKIAQMSFDEYASKNVINSQIPFTKDMESIQKLYKDVGIKKLSTCRAYHCNWAYSCSITFRHELDESAVDRDEVANLFKVSYSGDTRPNPNNFAGNIGLYSDLLIHEATLENDLLEEAKKKRHCTINEAIEVSNTMKARKLILTHFSQRYPQLPHISNNIVVNSDYCFAFDTMIVKYGDIGEQIKVFDQLDIAFASEQTEMDEDDN
ncbi:CYFA0S01e08592g1_1 [Cyberlindnera fabianii]|uniref:ribonuclease Z n=1 Tax=Cyberlindnera fabianii TaxID=36022 RepID=A0A061AR67_CYBFA|nr:CYFA0S01e08592g1_1 [Cyberlindnera fabianii]